MKIFSKLELYILTPLPTKVHISTTSIALLEQPALAFSLHNSFKFCTECKIQDRK